MMGIMFILPQVTFAVWWNPRSWSIYDFIFHSKHTQTTIEDIKPSAVNEGEAPFITSKSPVKKVSKDFSSTTKMSAVAPRRTPPVVPPPLQQSQTNQQIYSPTTIESLPNLPDTKVSIVVLAPNGGENLQVGDSVTLRWSSVNVSNIYFALTDASGNEKITNLAQVNPSSGQATWYVSSNIPYGLYKLKIGAYSSSDACGDGSCSAHNFLAYDLSDSTFTISAPSIPLPEPVIPQKSITFITPVGGETYYTAKSSFPTASQKIGWAAEGDIISFTWRWTGTIDHTVWPSVYLHNMDTGGDVGEFIPANFNNYTTSQGAITSLRHCLYGFACPVGFVPGRYQLRLCEFPDDGNPTNNALYPVGKTPLCSFSPVFTIQNPINTLDIVPDQQPASTTQL